MKVAALVIVAGVGFGVLIAIAWSAREAENVAGIAYDVDHAELEDNDISPAPPVVPPTGRERAPVVASSQALPLATLGSEIDPAARSLVFDGEDNDLAATGWATSANDRDDVLQVCDGSDRNGSPTMRGEDHAQADFEDAQLACADLREAVLVGANLMRADLRGANLTDARLHGALLHHVDFRNAVLVNADMSRTTFIATDLRGADLQGTSFRCSHCIERRRAFFMYADMRNADFRGVDFGFSWLHSVRLQGADLRGANLKDVLNFNRVPSGASMAPGRFRSDDALQGALYNTATQFPAGFDPAASGMIFVGGRGAGEGTGS